MFSNFVIEWIVTLISLIFSTKSSNWTLMILPHVMNNILLLYLYCIPSMFSPLFQKHSIENFRLNIRLNINGNIVPDNYVFLWTDKTSNSMDALSCSGKISEFQPGHVESPRSMRLNGKEEKVYIKNGELQILCFWHKHDNGEIIQGRLIDQLIESEKVMKVSPFPSKFN